jgi:hypothetical protein
VVLDLPITGSARPNGRNHVQTGHCNLWLKQTLSDESTAY